SADRRFAPPTERARGGARRLREEGQGVANPHRRPRPAAQRRARPAGAGIVALPLRLLRAAAHDPRQSPRHPHRRRPLRLPVRGLLRYRQGHARQARRPRRARRARRRAAGTREEDPGRDRLGAAGRRPHRRAADQQPAVQEQLGAFGRARDLGRAISHRQERIAAAAGGRRLRRVPADRYRQDRGGVQPQPPHRAEADGAVSGPSFTLRRYAPADEDAAIELWRRSWQVAYPQIDFAARADWWRQRWRDQLVPAATITVAETDGAIIGFVTVDSRT